MRSLELTVQTGRGRGLFDLTARCSAFVRDAAGDGDGLLSVFVPHATAGLVIVEIGAGSDEDLVAVLDRLLPRLAPPSLTVPVIGGALALGTWQSICLLDPNVDNPVRTVRLSFVAG